MGIRTDEEQAEALKKWWADNGKSLLITVLIAGGGFFGWNTWKEKQQATGEGFSGVQSADSAGSTASCCPDRRCERRNGSTGSAIKNRLRQHHLRAITIN